VLDVINAGQPALPHQPAVQFSFYLSMLGDWPAAAEVLKKIVEAYPDDIEALKNLGTCLARTGQLAAAYEAQQKVLSVQPDTASST
jgi:Flp pilus assembly protein TadD